MAISVIILLVLLVIVFVILVLTKTIHFGNAGATNAQVVTALQNGVTLTTPVDATTRNSAQVQLKLAPMTSGNIALTAQAILLMNQVRVADIGGDSLTYRVTSTIAGNRPGVFYDINDTATPAPSRTRITVEPSMQVQTTPT